ncbi:unannotated protein [freshwater metagenome]|uniref:Unannotated protein n=1 Tax=freshwater metagenome TaxID=449393 RepID=A0A6J5Z7V8_9ZZZZ
MLLPEVSFKNEAPDGVSNRSWVPGMFESMVVDGVKLEVYTAVPITYRKSLMYPLKNSLYVKKLFAPIARLVLVLPEKLKGLPIAVPLRYTVQTVVPLLTIAIWFHLFCRNVPVVRSMKELPTEIVIPPPSSETSIPSAPPELVRVCIIPCVAGEADVL